MDALYIISSIVSLVFLICFFYLCANVSIIKKNTPRNNPDYWEAQYHKHASCNRDALALYALQEFIYLTVSTTYGERRKHVYETLLDKYGDTVKAYGGKFMKL